MFVYNCQILQYFTKLFYVLKAFNFQLNINKKNNQNQIHDIDCFFCGGLETNYSISPSISHVNCNMRKLLQFFHLCLY